MTMIDLGTSIGIQAGRAAAARSFVQAGRLPNRKASLKDTSHLTPMGDVVMAPEAIELGAQSRVTHNEVLDGEIWVHTVLDELTGNHRARMQSPYYAPESTRSQPGMQTWKFPNANNQQGLDVICGTGSAGTLRSFQAYDMQEVLSRPAKVIVAAGQSLMECSHNAYGVDPKLDYWPGPRCLCIPGYTYAGFGTTRGEVHSMSAPLMFKSIGVGVSPAVSFAQEIMPFVPETHNLVIICAAYSSTTLVGPDGDWNPDGVGQNVAAYQNAVDLVNLGMSNLPEGSEIIGWLWAQGQGDLAADMNATYPPAFAAMRAAAEAATGTAQVPWMLFGPPPDADSIHTQVFTQMYADMDQDSGHSSAQPLAHSIEHPPGYIEDGVHVTAWGSRVMGKLAARRFISEGYL